jgi:hypothetical protein
MAAENELSRRLPIGWCGSWPRSSRPTSSAAGAAAAANLSVGSRDDVQREIIGTTLEGCVGAVRGTGTGSMIALRSIALCGAHTALR